MQQQYPCYGVTPYLYDESIEYSPNNYPELWLAFIHPDRLENMLVYVDTKQMRELILTWERGVLSQAYSLFQKTVEHSKRISDPSLLYLIFFHCIAYMEPVTKWAKREEIPRTPAELELVKPRLPVGCENACICAFRNICWQYANRKITMNKFNFLIFSAINTGCADVGSVDWAEPPAPNDDWESVLAKRASEMNDDISDLTLQASVLFHRKRDNTKRILNSTAKQAIHSVNGEGGEKEGSDVPKGKSRERGRGRGRGTPRSTKFDPRKVAVPLGRQASNFEKVGSVGAAAAASNGSRTMYRS
jgi:hypothetical protein